MFYSKDEKTTLRKQPSQRRSGEVFEAIIEATLLLLNDHNYEQISTNLIAEKAGVSIGSLYQYFEGKISIFSVLVDRKIQENSGRLIQSVQFEHTSVKQYFEALLNAAYDVYIEDRETIQKYFLSEILMLKYKDLMDSRKRMATHMCMELKKYFPEKTNSQLEQELEICAHSIMGVIHSIIWNERNFMKREPFVSEGILMVTDRLGCK